MERNAPVMDTFLADWPSSGSRGAPDTRGRTRTVSACDNGNFATDFAGSYLSVAINKMRVFYAEQRDIIAVSLSIFLHFADNSIATFWYMYGRQKGEGICKEDNGKSTATV
jgi:hypothetical protein